MSLGTVEEIPTKKKLLHTLSAAIKKRKFELIAKSCNDDRSLVEECHRLDSCHFKTLAATQVLAHNQIVAADHVGAGLGKFGAIALIGAWRKLSFLGAYQPGQFVFIGLLTMRAVQGVRLPGFFLVKKIALIHKQSS